MQDVAIAGVNKQADNIPDAMYLGVDATTTLDSVSHSTIQGNKRTHHLMDSCLPLSLLAQLRPAYTSPVAFLLFSKTPPNRTQYTLAHLSSASITVYINGTLVPSANSSLSARARSARRARDVCDGAQQELARV